MPLAATYFVLAVSRLSNSNAHISAHHFQLRIYRVCNFGNVGTNMTHLPPTSSTTITPGEKHFLSFIARSPSIGRSRVISGRSLYDAVAKINNLHKISCSRKANISKVKTEFSSLSISINFCLVTQRTISMTESNSNCCTLVLWNFQLVLKQR